MSETITATFSPAYLHAKEASNAAAPLMQTRRVAWVSRAYNFAFFMLTMIGSIAFLLTILGDIANIGYLYVLVIAAIFTWGLFSAGANLERASYAAFIKTDFGKSNTIKIDASGVTLIASQSKWDTSWTDIVDIFRTTNTIGWVTPVMPMFLPTSSLEDPDVAFAQMRRWHQSTRGSSS